jgi:hypothetical protein
MRAANRADIALGILAIGVAAAYGALIPYGVTLEHAPMGITGRFFPWMAAFIVGTSGLALVVRALLAGGGRASSEGIDARSLRRLMPYFGVTIAYVALIDVAGYLVSTVVALVGFLWLAGERRPLMIVAVTVAVSGGLYVLFQYGMQVPLPQGFFL